ncbi:hypothetical protein BAUCODRAFT_23750 [Baudoinia panamericana UAMH 10762]|uniref:Uncharacterized protein n=1 Tax=Baudoinia panamericana (strain UAMH 10762) TaxID=717646 RepID=M2N0L5_BAUPA|nr:uncharacterized protein BAUCODRAFT_23750 [Baudoinia panamericana UAMH 10762]EMC97463.1 hypothetical protein BAUCODRAFT_23750 [Baudoinia panamericana UAMH 10762]
MPRMTRAKAAQVAEELHVDEDAVLDLNSENAASIAKIQIGTATPDNTPNSGSNKSDECEPADLKRSTRSTKASTRVVKGKKGGESAAENVPEAEAELVNVKASEDGDLASATAFSGTIAAGPRKSLMRNMSEDSLAFEDDEPDSDDEAHNATGKSNVLMDQAGPTPPINKPDTTQPLKVGPETIEPENLTATDAPPSPLPSATPKAVASLRKTPGMRSTSNKENVQPADAGTPTPRPATLSHRRVSTYDALEAAAVQAGTPSTLPRKLSGPQLPVTDAEGPGAEVATELPVDPTNAIEATELLEEPVNAIDAIDALDEAVEKVAAEMPVIEDSPQKPKSKKAVPIVRTTKASQARVSMAQAEKAGANKPSASIHPRASNTLRQSSTSMRQSILATSSLTSKRVPATTTAAVQPLEKKETVIPHSKPRPVSLSFPTPPPPSKSKKAPTTSTFQLPGEAVAAKLKAAKEERQKREAEAEEKKAAFKARPVPTALQKAPNVRQTHASKARESLMNAEKQYRTYEQRRLRCDQAHGY